MTREKERPLLVLTDQHVIIPFSVYFVHSKIISLVILIELARVEMYYYFSEKGIFWKKYLAH